MFLIVNVQEDLRNNKSIESGLIFENILKIIFRGTIKATNRRKN